MTSQRIHMVGVGGIGMSALAQLYAHRGVDVTGSDRSESPLTVALRAKGIPVIIGHTADAVSDDTDLLVYSDAVRGDNPERLRAKEMGITEQSYFEALGDATKQGVSIVVTGTHGKTTTTAMLAKVLVDCGKDPTVICGSIMSEFGSNFRAGRPDLFVIEGCEYMRHFLHLHPHILVINNIELDHTDYYTDLSDMQSAFRSIAERVPAEGAIIADTSALELATVLSGLSAPIVSYQDVTVPPLKVPGTFNGSNARAAKAAALALESALDDVEIDRALGAFAGTWRRFEYKGVTQGGAVVYDDYAHHPTAVRNTLTMARSEFADKRIVVVFHPHLYSRTRDFMDELASALALADEVLLAPIYAAREEPIEGVTSEVLAEKIVALGTSAQAFDSLANIIDYLSSTSYKLSCPQTDPPAGGQATSLLVTMGAGDVYHVADALAGRG